jgi:predicted transcriptional regulator
LSIQLLVIKDKDIVCRTPVYLPGSKEIDESAGAMLPLPELAGIFAIASNERRLRIMTEMLRRPETRFTDLLPVAVNPKLIHDCLRPMAESGLVIHESRGSSYLLSSKGILVVTTLTRGITEMLKAAEEGRI